MREVCKCGKLFIPTDRIKMCPTCFVLGVNAEARAFSRAVKKGKPRGVRKPRNKPKSVEDLIERRSLK